MGQHRFFMATAELWPYPLDYASVFVHTDSDRLYRTFDAGGSQRKHFISAWVKPTTGSPNIHLLTLIVDANNYTQFYIVPSLGYQLAFDGKVAGASFAWRSNDGLAAGSWHHIAASIDTTQATAADRFKLWFNGVEVTTWAAAIVAMAQNADLVLGSAAQHNLGWDGYTPSPTYGSFAIADYNYVNGTNYTAADVGQLSPLDGTTWVAKNTSGLTFGTNGVRQQYATSGNQGDDTSGNAGDWTTGGTPAQSTTTPSNP